MAKLATVGLAASAALSLHACSRADAEPQPDPAQLQQFLAQLEAREKAVSGEAKRKKGHEKRLLQAVESAATRAPSEAMINRIENAFAVRL